MLTTRKKDCSIIITTYNGAKWIKDCIASCLKSEYPVHIIVVDNNSTDNTLELLPEGVHLIKLSQNLGFGRANNIGMSEAFERFDSKYVFLLNQDAYIKGNTISELVKCHEQNPGLGLISPLHYGQGWLEYDYRFKIYMKRAKPQENGIHHSKFVNAAAWFMPKETVLKNGGFDPIFFHTGEDDNFCQRLRSHKIQIGITKKTEILHDRQDRVKPKTPPHLKVANRAKIIIFNPDMNGIMKFFHLVPLAFFYLVNLTLPEYRTKKKRSKDRQEFKAILDYHKKSKQLYKTDGIFLKQDYP
ncbi:MAG: glycosyltransferase family 2 protein, partial [Saprospiraceae bacterium]